LAWGSLPALGATAAMAARNVASSPAALASMSPVTVVSV
jgi:hypothetical protein